jgi:antitoxin component YwqK of YwqJK toxin-antitoxin module
LGFLEYFGREISARTKYSKVFIEVFVTYKHTFEKWKNADGVLHRDDGPAIIIYFSNGTIESESFYINGKLHREDGPAIIIYFSNGTIESESFYISDKLHREDGPSQIYYNSDGSIDAEAFNISGVFFTFWEFWSYISEEKRQSHNMLKYLMRRS